MVRFYDASDVSFSERGTSGSSWLKAAKIIWACMYAVAGLLIPMLHKQERGLWAKMHQRIKAFYLGTRILLNTILSVVSGILTFLNMDLTTEDTTSQVTRPIFTAPTT